MKHLFYIIILFILLAPFKICAQKEASNWIFGLYDFWVVFSDSGPVAFTPPINVNWGPDFFESAVGASSVSDKEGNLLLYTNGTDIWDSTLNYLPYGSWLAGSYWGQCLIVPDPASDKRYYVFGSQFPVYLDHEIGWVLADLEMGQVISIGGLGTKMVSKLSSTYHANGKDIWILSHDWENNTFRTWLITDQGISQTPVISNIGLVQEDTVSVDHYNSASWGKIKFSPGGNYVAVTSVGLDALEVFKFNNETGTLSDSLLISLDRVYTVEFSSNGTVLYYGQHYNCYGSGCPSYTSVNKPLYQIDLLAGNDSAIINSQVVISNYIQSQNPPYGPQIQLASDGKIYCDSQDWYIPAIDNPNLLDSACNFANGGIIIPNGYAGTGPIQIFPDFFRSYLDFNIEFEGECVGDSTMIYTLTNQGFDSIRWEFEDTLIGLSLSIPNEDTIYYTFSQVGEYEISLKRYRNGNLDELKKILRIKPYVDIQLPTDTIICDGSEVIFSSSHPICEFAWINDYSTDSLFGDYITISQQGSYWPIITNFENYCGNLDTINVIVQFDSLYLGNDTSGVCNLNLLSLNAYQGIGSDYQWSTGDSLPEIIATITEEYSVTVTKNYCEFTDTIYVEYINPVNILLPEDSLICVGEMAEFSVNSSYYDYAWINNTNSDTINSGTIQISEPGTYWPIATNYSTYCGSIDSITVSVHYDSLNIGNDTTGACLTSPLTIDATLDSATYLWSTGETTASIIAPESNYYIVTVTQGYCTWQDTIHILYDEPLLVTLPDTSIICDSLEIELSAGDVIGDFLWSPTGETTVSIMVIDQGLYSVTATNGCGDFIDSSVVVAMQSPVVDLGSDTTICTTIPLLLDASTSSILSGTEVYLWSTGETDSAIWVELPGLYKVYVSNECGNASDTINIETNDPVLINLGNDTIICFGEDLLIVPEIIGNGELLWSTGETTNGITINNEDEYILYVTNVCGEFTDTLNLAIQINDFAFLEDTIFISGGDSCTLSGVEVYSAYQWSTGETTPTITVSEIDTYTLTVIDSVGCEASDSVVVAWPNSIDNISYFDNIKVYPNPVRDELVIEGLRGDENILVRDLLGRQITIELLNHSPLILNFNQEPKGVYLLVFMQGEKIKTYTLVKI